MTNTPETEKFKKVLETEKAELERQIAELKKPVDMGDDIDSFDEETDEATEFSANMGMVAQLKRRYHRIVDALSKMIKGTYGRCEACKNKIEPEVLAVDPESRFCRSCKLQVRS